MPSTSVASGDFFTGGFSSATEVYLSDLNDNSPAAGPCLTCDLGLNVDAQKKVYIPAGADWLSTFNGTEENFKNVPKNSPLKLPLGTY